MALNTSIRGLQIKDAFFGDGIKRNAVDGDIAELALKTDAGLAIDTAELKVVAGDGLDTDATGVLVDVTDFIDTATGLTETSNDIQINIKANDGLEFDTNQLTVDYDDSTISIVSNALAVKDDGITAPKLQIVNAEADGQVLSWSAGDGKMKWINPDVDAVQNADIEVENLSAEIDATGYAGEHTLANTPIAKSVSIHLNGLLQEEGSGKDYTIAGATFTFATQPESGDIIIVRYIISD